ncbi:MAG: NAD-dependent epimerase/dehydratase family protein [Gammaproteobacteria bacterium]|nr:NAD-dependent epimerase/dehydratase family protein [Gammaproteobacteria bacterium]
MFTLVAGAGYTGRRVLERLPAADVIGLSRSPVDSDRPTHLFDFDERQALPLALPDRYAVLYTCPPDGEDDERLQRFLSLLAPVPTRFVYISTTGVYGDARGAVVTEESPVDPGNGMARARIAAETILASAAANSGYDLVVLRVPGIYGPGRLPLQRINDGGTFLEESEASPGNRIHVDDLASCCIAALREDVPAGIYNVGDGDHRSSTWFAQEVARQAGLPAPQLISREEAEKAFSPIRLAFLSSSRIVDTTRMREVLDVTPRYSNPVDGIEASLA